MSENQSRLFFALWPNQAVRAQIENSPFPRLKPNTTPRENWHITLLFLGPTTSSQRIKFEQAAATIQARSFTLSLDKFGQFGRARVAWLGCSQPPETLIEFQQHLESALRDACPDHTAFKKPVQPFKPHVTLYRHIKNKVPEARISPVEWNVREFCLIESRPDQRPVYRVLSKWQLETD